MIVLPPASQSPATVSDATLAALLGLLIFLVGQFFLFLTNGRPASDEYSRGIRVVANPVRWIGLAMLVIGGLGALVSFLA